MPRQQQPGDGDGGGGPSPADQNRAALRARRALSESARTVEVRAKDGRAIVKTAPLSFQGNAFDADPAYDAEERQVVVTATVPILSGTAAARPADPGRPTLYIATDTGAHSTWDGSTWRTI